MMEEGEPGRCPARLKLRTGFVFHNAGSLPNFAHRRTGQLAAHYSPIGADTRPGQFRNTARGHWDWPLTASLSLRCSMRSRNGRRFIRSVLMEGLANFSGCSASTSCLRTAATSK